MLRWCSERRRAGLLGVPMGGGPPVSRPRRELRLARRLEARPGPAATHGRRSQALRALRRPPHRRRLCCWCVAWYVVSKPGQAPPPPINFARNSPAACSNIEFASLELQRFWGVSKNDHDKLRAKFGRRWCRCCPWASQAGPWALRSRASRDTTEAGPRRIPPLVACDGRAVGAGKPAPETQRPSLSSVTTAAVASGANAQFFHQPLTVSTAWAPRSDRAEWALTRPEDRRAAWKREATFSQFTRFHQALT